MAAGAAGAAVALAVGAGAGVAVAGRHFDNGYLKTDVLENGRL
ncbi:hypothetical protein P5F54_15200 [Clostridium perfringens]|nr:hypothetical protein [Clostridium perfringens]